MKKKGIGKRILSVLLAFALTVSAMPAGQIVAFADASVKIPNVSNSTTGYYANVTNAYANMLVDKNNAQSSYKNYDFTWTTETGKGDSWRYYNGIMLDALMALNPTNNISFVRSVYDNGNIDVNGNIANWHPDELDSVPMGLALFDILDQIGWDYAEEDTSNNVSISNLNNVADNTDGTLTFYESTNGNGYGVEITNPFVGKTITDGATISFWWTPVGNKEDVNPLFSLMNYSNTEVHNQGTDTEKIWTKIFRTRFDTSGTIEYQDALSGHLSFNRSDINSIEFVDGEEYFVTLVFDVVNKKINYYINGSLYSTAYDTKLDTEKTFYMAEYLTSEYTHFFVGGQQVGETSADEYGNMLEDGKAIGDIDEAYYHDLDESTIVRNIKAYTSVQDPVVLYADATNHTNRYKEAIQNIFTYLEAQEMVENTGGNYYHKGSSNSTWSTYPVALDGLYMAQTFLMECANAIKNDKLDSLTSTITSTTGTIDSDNVYLLYEDIYDRLIWVADNLYDDETYLYNHAAGLDSNGRVQLNGIHWLRSIGWYAMALIDIIEMMPTSGSFTASDGETTMNYATMRTELIDRLVKLFDGMLRYQDTDTGMWTNVVNDKVNTEYDSTHINKFETSGTAMMAYALTKAYNLDLVSAKYGYAGIRAFNGVCKDYVTDTKTSYTTDAGGSETVYRVDNIYKSASVYTTASEYCVTGNYVSDEAKGTAPLIKASIMARAASTKLNNTIAEPSVLYDSETKITVETDDALGMTPTNVSTDANVANSVGDILDSGYEAWNLTFATGDASGNATIVDANGVAYIPISESILAKTLSVYYVNSDGTLTPVSAVIDQDNVVKFTMDHAGTYVFGSEKVWDDLAWVDVELTDEYEPVYTMVPEETDGYVITQPGIADSEKYALGYNTTSAQKGITTNLRSVDDGYIFNNVAIDENTTWYIDNEGYIYCVVGGTTYYLDESLIGNIPSTSKFSLDNLEVVDTYNGSNVYEEVSTYVQCNPAFTGGYVLENGDYTYVAPCYETYSDEDNIATGTIKGSLALYASASANFVEDNGTSFKPDNYFYYWAKDVANTWGYAQGAIGKTAVNTEPSAWHEVVVVIKNDSVTQYVDGVEVATSVLQNAAGGAFGANTDSYGAAFNKGYGYGSFGSFDTIKTYNQNGINILDFLTDSGTTLTIGGTPNSVYKNGSLSQYADAGVLLDDIKFYNIPFTAQQAANTASVSQLPIASHSFVLNSEPSAECSYSVGIKADPTNESNAVFEFKWNDSGYAKIDNPYLGYNLSEETIVQDGYPVWNKGVTITYKVYAPSATSDAPVLVFNNGSRTVMSAQDEDKFNACAEYDEEAAKYGRELILTTTKADALKWSYHRATTGVQLTALSEYTGDIIYMVAPTNTGDTYKVTSTDSAIALWSKTGEDAPLGAEATLTGTLEHYVIKGNSFTLADMQESAQVYYRASSDSTPILVDSDSSYWDNVTWTWKDATLDTNTAGLYTLEVKYNGIKLGEITVEVQETKWVDILAYNEDEIEDYLYVPVTKMDEDWEFGYVIAKGDSNNQTDTEDEANSVFNILGAKSFNNLKDFHFNANIIDNKDGYYSINVNEYNLWNIENNRLYVLVEGNKKYLKFSDIYGKYDLQLVDSIDDATEVTITPSDKDIKITWPGTKESGESATINLKCGENFYTGGSGSLALYKRVPVKYTGYTRVTAMDESNTHGYLIAGDYESFSKFNGIARNADGSAFERVGIIINESETGSNIYYTTTNITNAHLWYFDEGESSDTGAIYSVDDNGVKYYIAGVVGSSILTTDTTLETYFDEWGFKIVDSETDPYKLNVCFYTSDNKFRGILLKSGTSVNSSPSGIYLYSRTIPEEVQPSTDSQIALIGKKEYTVYAGSTTLEEYQILQNASLYQRSGEGVSPTAVAWDNELVDYTWAPSLDDANAGTYVMTVTYDGVEIDKVTVTVKAPISYSLEGIKNMTTYVGRTPDLSELKYTITYDDGTTDVITTENGLTISGLEVATTGEKTVSVMYNGAVIDGGTFTLTVVDNDLYAGLDDATKYPTYPEAGSVRIKKSASNDEFAFYETGVAKLELTAAGVASQGGIDVVLVTDVSNSMAWTDDWFNIYPGATQDMYKIPQLGTYSSYEEAAIQTEDKLDAAMEAASNFARTLLANNDDNEETNNSISFVTFAGNDRDNLYNTTTYGNYIDSVQTVFTGVQDLDKALTSFSNTKFIKSEPTVSGGATYTLQIGKTNGVSEVGLNRGNTNYDFAYAEAAKAVDALQAKYDNYEESGRTTIVLFMSDGAPSHYNDIAANGAGSDFLYGTKKNYTGFDVSELKEQADKNAAWLTAIETPNKYASELGERVDSFYGVGFDLDHGGFSSYSWTTEQLRPVFEKMAGTDALGKNRMIKVLMADNASELLAGFDEIASELVYSGSEAWVTDIVGNEYDVALGTAVRDLNGVELDVDDVTSGNQVVTPNIQVLWYELYTSATCGDNEALIGTRVTNPDGTVKDPVVLETVSFTEEVKTVDGVVKVEITGAYSDKLGASNIYFYDSSTGITTITGKYFTYTMEPEYTGEDGYPVTKETFKWNVGIINEGEFALSYYVYLTGSSEGWREAGTYETNEEAYIEYIDVNGDKAKQIYDIPRRPWGSAATIIEYYLVNENGQPVNKSGTVVAFDDRVVVPLDTTTLVDEKEFQVAWQTSLNIKAAAYVPTNYALYSESAEYTVSVDATGVGTLYITDNTEVVGSDHEISTVWNNKGAVVNTTEENEYQYNVEITRVSFAVVYSEQIEVGAPIGIDRVVVDYGKAIDVDVLANNTGFTNNQTYSAKIVGFRAYDTNPDLINYVQVNKGLESITEEYGTFTLVDDDTVRFTMSKMLDRVQKVFTVVEVTEIGTTNYFYLYQELEVIPANVMYYETDFTDGVFTLLQSESDVYGGTHTGWVEKSDNLSVTDTLQDNGAVGQSPAQTYGFDSSYSSDAAYSNGESWYVEGEGLSVVDGKLTYHTTANFNFTGTGFDIISRTGTEQGMINVKVFDAVTGQRKKNVSVLNKSDTNWEIYQIPVMSIQDLPYGNYDVEIAVLEEYASEGTGSGDPFVDILNRGNQFYFDAVRIYDPINVVYSGDDTTEYCQFNYQHGYLGSDSTYISADERTDEIIALSAYSDDGEAKPQIYEFRNMLLAAEDVNGIISNADSESGVVLIDSKLDGMASATDYELGGPNNEVYLTKGQAIVFTLKVDDYTSLRSIDVGGKCVKSIDGTDNTIYKGAQIYATIHPANYVAGDADKDKQAYINFPWFNSSTSQYFAFESIGNYSISDVFDVGNGVVYVRIYNNGDSVLSITDLKLGYEYDEATVSATSVAYFYVDQETLSYANMFSGDSTVGEVNYDIMDAKFTSKEYRLFGDSELIVKTSDDVETIKITDRFGRKIQGSVSYEDTEYGTRVWTIKMLMDASGNRAYTVIGYGSDGTAGQPITVNANVNIEEGGGMQDAKRIFKTLFNCRILSIKRSDGNKLQ